MAQSLLTQRGVGVPPPPKAKKWRKRCTSSSSSSSSCCSSDSEDGEGSGSAEREFSIVKEGSFANGPLKLRIAARKVKKLEEDEERNGVAGTASRKVSNDVGRKPKCKRKIEKKRCLQTKDPRVACAGGPFACKQPRSSRRCSTSGSSSSSSSSGSSSSGSSGSSSSGSSSSGSCSSGSSSGSSSAGSGSSSSSSGSSSSSSSSSGSSSGSDSASCCSIAKYGRCRRRRRKSSRRKSKCRILRGKRCSAESSGESCSGSRSRCEKSECSRKKCSKKLQVNEIDCFSVSSTDGEEGAKSGPQQECFSMWRKVEEEHCAIIEKGSEVQVLSVTNAEVECNINSGEQHAYEPCNRVEEIHEEDKHPIIRTDDYKNNQNQACSYDFACMERIPVMKEHIASNSTSIDLDALPSSLNNVSPDSGIQSSGDSPLRIECELPPLPQRTKNPTDDFYVRTSSADMSNSLQVPKHNSPGLSPPVLTPPEPLWTAGSCNLPHQSTEKRKCDDHPAPLLMQVNTAEVKYHHQLPGPVEAKVSMFPDYKFPTPDKSTIESADLGSSSKLDSLSLCTNDNKDSFSQSSLNLMFHDSVEKSEPSLFQDQTSSQTASDFKRKRRAFSQKERRQQLQSC